METNIVLTPEFLSLIAGTIISLALSYIPGLKAWYEKLSGDWKRFILLVCLALAAAGVFALGCAGFITTAISCDKMGVWAMVQYFILAAIASQGTYQLTNKK